MFKRTSDSIFRVIPLFLIFMGVLVAFQRVALFFFPNTPIHLADETLHALAIVSIFYYAIKTNQLPVDQASLLTITIALILLSVIFGQQNNIYYIIGQSIISFKLFYFLTVLLNHPKQQLMFAVVKKTMLLITSVALVGIVINLVYPSLFTDFFDGKAIVRTGGTERIQSFFLNSNYLGFTIAVTFSYASFFLLKSTLTRLCLILMALILVFMTGSRSALMMVLISPFFLIAHLNKRSQLTSVVALIIGSIGATGLAFYNDWHHAFFDIYELTIKDFSALSTIDDSRYIRAVVFYYGFELMLSNFPFGTGAATYASQFSANSPVYETLNIRAIYFFEEMSSAIFDSNWGTIMGELGLIGILVYGFLLRKVYTKIHNYLMGHKVNIGYLRFITLSIILSAFSAPVFTHGYLAILFASALFMSLNSNIQHSINSTFFALKRDKKYSIKQS